MFCLNYLGALIVDGMALFKEIDAVGASNGSRTFLKKTDGGLSPLNRREEEEDGEEEEEEGIDDDDNKVSFMLK